jgi:hypothetical protein
MSVTLSHVLPWGRSLDEYKRLFDLNHEDLASRILGCGDGPASFNSELTSLGGSVVSVDPIYALSKEEIELRVEQTYDVIISQVKQTRDNYIWRYFEGPDELGRHRLECMRKFLDDYTFGLAEERYSAQGLPSLSFDAQRFDLALCSHLLFLYSDQLNFDFHRDSIQELCRVAREVRIFPLVGLDCKPSPHVEPIRDHFVDAGYNVDLQVVPYEFQRGGNRMMKIRGSD